jgi:N-acetylmuramoyl-L-alanine amidase
VLQAGPGQPPIIARSAWAQGMSHPRVAPQYGTVRMAFVHHTDNPNGYSAGEVPAMLRSIYVFHRYVNGWNDIGYNFAIDAFGRVFEARAGGVDEPVIGAHAGGYNYASSGIAVLGTYSSQPISAAAHTALERLLAWKLALHGVPAQGRVTVRVDPSGAVYSRFPANAPVSLPRIAGHRDADTTDCPGDALYAQLPASRARVKRLAPSPLRLTLALAPAPAPAPAPDEPGSTTPSTPPPTPAPAPGTGTPTSTPTPAPSETAVPPTPTGAPPAPAAAEALEGVLEVLDGTPVAGAAITVQARSVTRRGELVRERTIAQAVTDAQGRWSAPVSSSAPSAGGMALRALYEGTNQPGAAPGAAVSDPLHVAGTLISPAGSPGAAGAPPTEQAA